jgi:CBS domain-containing protein
MRVSAILAHKGREVLTIRPDATLAAAAEELRAHGIGALVVCEPDQPIRGVVSERDIVRRLAEVGSEMLDAPVSSVMTVDVVTCTPHDTTEHLMEVVTTRRIRHVPVVEDDKLAGLVSIGDIVAARVRDLEEEAHLLREYIGTR